jgi:hypothetical protein
VQVTGPIPNATRDNPFAAAVGDLSAYGYVEEEFFFEGQACAYEPMPGTSLSVDGRWQLQPERTAPFKTRILVERPEDPSKFTGTVFVSWTNVSVGFEVNSVMNTVLERGDAWVAVSAQKVGIEGGPATKANGLHGWDPERYSSLQHPGDDFSFDVYTHAARIVGPQRGRSPDPMGGLDVQHVFGIGGSQSGLRLNTYIDGVHPLARAFDGFLPLLSFGRAARLDTRDAPLVLEKSWLDYVVQIRDDLDVPVLALSTESEAVSLYPVRQPDTDTIRTWEIAGAAHVGGAAEMAYMANVFARDALAFPEGMGGGTPGTVPNDIYFWEVMNAAYDHLVRWASDGSPPPSFPLIDFEGDPPEIKRDHNGNATGGIRVPEMEVPTAQYRGTSDGEGMGALLGTMETFSPEKLRALYPTNADFLAKWSAAVDRGVADGFISARDTDAVNQIGVERAARFLPG